MLSKVSGKRVGMSKPLCSDPGVQRGAAEARLLIHFAEGWPPKTPFCVWLRVPVSTPAPFHFRCSNVGREGVSWQVEVPSRESSRHR